MKRLFALLATLALLSTAVAAADNPRVRMETSHGPIVLELYPEKAPKSVENFLQYVRDGFYDGTIFHRIIDDFMIQGGGFSRDMQRKPTRPGIANEANNGLKNERGTIAMARTRDPHSASSQFFINVKDNAFLDHTAETPQGWGYAVFGEVVDGMDTVDKIKGVETGVTKGMRDVPKEPVVIEQATVASQGE